MKFPPLRLSAALLALGIAACTPLVAEYTESEAPNRLATDTISTRIDLRFAHGSDRLPAGEAQRLQRLATSGTLTPSDRITVSAAGSPALAARRIATVASQLLQFGIVIGTRPAIVPPADRAILAVDRTLVSLPPCPNWSKPPQNDFTNALSSNYGCSTAVNLGRTVASPSDLASGRPVASPDGTPAVAAVVRYLTDRVQLPAGAAVGPIAPSASSAPGAQGGTPTSGSGS